MFTVVVAPAVFKVLSQKAAASYLRVLFPRLFMFGFVTSSIATIFLMLDGELLITVVSTTIAFGFLFNALILNSKINQFRDRANAGEVDAEKMFARLHLFSVGIFGSQFFASLYLIISQTYFSLKPNMTLSILQVQTIFKHSISSHKVCKFAVVALVLGWSPIGEAQNLTNQLNDGVGLACEKEGNTNRKVYRSFFKFSKDLKVVAKLLTIGMIQPTLTSYHEATVLPEFIEWENFRLNRKTLILTNLSISPQKAGMRRRDI